MIRIEPATARDHDTFVELDGVVPALHASAHPDLFKRDVVLRPAGSPSSSRGRASLWLAYDCDRAVGYLYTEHKHRAETRFQHAPPSSTSITSRAAAGSARRPRPRARPRRPPDRARCLVVQCRHAPAVRVGGFPRGQREARSDLVIDVMGGA